MIRNILLPFLTSVLTLSLMVFVSCAHTAPTEGDDSLDVSDGSSETSEAGAETEAAAEVPPAGVDAAKTDTPPLDLVEAVESKPDAATIEDGSAVATGNAATGDEMLSEIENGAPATAPPVDIVPPSDVVAAPDASLTGLPAMPVSSGPVSSRLPRIPKMAIQKGGVSLNRFYFIRKGDTAEGLATLILGSAGKAALLKKWNAGLWKPGMLLFYASVTDPSDKQMQSFYQERNVSSEPYQIGRGDWLSKIAAKRYRSPMSWKEIAVLNGIRTPDSIENGKRISLYPSDLSGYTGASQLAQKKDVPSEQPSSGQPDRQALAGAESQPPPQAAPLDPPAQEASPDIPPPSVQGNDVAAGGGTNIMGLLEQNIIFIATGAAIVLLLIALIAIKKKKARAGAEEFGEDPMAPPKARRK